MHRATILMSLAFAACAAAPAVHDAYPSGAPRAAADSAELARLHAEDQADRTPPAGAAIDWTRITPRDHVRAARIKELNAEGRLQTAADFHHAAMILQHGDAPEDFLLAHELCILAIASGDASALWLCAASEDRFLGRIERKQRFATQYRNDGPATPMRLTPVDDGVTDAMRASFHCPTLAEAKANEARFNRPAKQP